MTDGDQAAEPARRPRKAPFSYRIGVVLAALAVVPLLGAGWFAVHEVRAAQREQDRATVVDRSVDELVTLSDLGSLLVNERNWQAALDGIEQLGLPSAVVIDLTGIDVPAQAAAARAAVDDVLAVASMSDVATTLAGLRVEADRARLPGEVRGAIEESYEGYKSLEVDVAQRGGLVLDGLMASAGGGGDGGALVTALRVLEASTLARQSQAAEFYHYFSAQFSNYADRGDEVEGLVAEERLRTRSLGEIARMSPAGAGTREVLTAIELSPEVATFDRAVDALIDSTLSGEAADASLAAVLADLDGVAQTFNASSVSAEIYVELVHSAGQDTFAASDALRASARARNRDALTSLAAMVLCSMLFALASSRAIGRPIGRLAHTARQIRDGRSDIDQIRTRGPIEVREAAQALNEAAQHLALTERQALALAEGDLEHASLREESRGQLGASLQNAVQTLAASMHEREEFRRRMTHEATHDGLTQLPNRNASLSQLQRGLARVARSHSRLAVLFIDLDGFKDVNDHHGHHAGDVVLCTTAQRLVNAVREGDHVGRLGGDEFIVIAEPVADLDEAVGLAHRIHEILVAPIQVDATTVSIHASTGIAMGTEQTLEASDLLRDADLAVYKAKAEGRGRIEICDEQLRTAMFQRVDLEQALRHALIDEQLILYYQPIVHPSDHRLLGFEALIRWNRPEHGVVGPDDFIPFAERSDLIIAIDRWVLRNVARQVVAWDAAGQFVETPISINVSGRHLCSPHFVEHVLAPLDEYGIDPSRIVIEVTESALLEDLTAAAAKLQQLRQRGIRTAIDDFGTGYTSLAHLKSLPIDILKIDQSFTTDVSAASLVQLIIDTGHLLGATVTAEGIETEAQAAELRRMGTDELQGYLYGVPKPAADLVSELLREP